MSKRKPKPKPPTADESFRRASDGYTFRGNKLEPFSFLRQTAMIPISVEMGGSYASDIAIAMWLMHQPDAIVKQARQSPSEFTDQIDIFADQHGLGAIAGANFKEARQLFETIRADIEVATGKPDFGRSGENEEDEGETSGN